MKPAIATKGFTLMELMIVIAIISFLMILALISVRGQLSKSYDARRKSDLATIKRATEEYFNDHGCYPPAAALAVCGPGIGVGLQPYLKYIPCDPESKKPYPYEPVNGDPCDGFRLFGILSNKSDPVIHSLVCDTTGGCGAAAGTQYNYGVSSGVPVSSWMNATPTPTVPQPKTICRRSGGVPTCFWVLPQNIPAGCTTWDGQWGPSGCATNCNNATVCNN
jgi:prepilin-type N-terminal cleavage/methylation domain-containing protein